MRRVTTAVATYRGRQAHAGSQSPGRRAMRILRPQPDLPPPHRPRRPLPPPGPARSPLRCRLRLADGRVFNGGCPPARHRAIQLGLLHADTAAARRAHARHATARRQLAVDRRRRPEHYLPGGAGGRPRLARNLLAARRADRRRRLRHAQPR